MANWVQISEEQAKKHPLYGVRGWARFVVFVWIIGGLIGFFAAFGRAGNLEMVGRGDLGDITISFGVISLAVNVLCAILLLKRYQSFQKIVTIILIVGPILIAIVSASYGYRHIDIFAYLFASVFWGVIWLLYIWISKRINVTCQNRVRINDPFLNNITQPRDPTKSPTIQPQSNSKPITEFVSDTESTTDEISTAATSDISRDQESEFYAKALKELEEDKKDPADWARAFAEAGGEEKKAKAFYINHRVASLTDKLLEEQDKKKVEEEKTKMAEEEKSLTEDRARKILSNLGYKYDIKLDGKWVLNDETTLETEADLFYYLVKLKTELSDEFLITRLKKLGNRIFEPQYGLKDDWVAQNDRREQMSFKSKAELRAYMIKVLFMEDD